MLEFVEDGHKYLYNGSIVPSVSKLLRPLGEDPSEDGEEDALLESALDYASERGTVLHSVLQTLLSGEEPEEIPDAYAAHEDALRLFIAEHDIVPYMMETPLYSHSMGFAGTPDLVCCLNGKDAIVDYKFVSSINKTRVKAQLNAYKILCADNGVGIEALYAAQFMGNGRYRLYPVAIDENEFALCYGIYKAKNKKHPKGEIA